MCDCVFPMIGEQSAKSIPVAWVFVDQYRPQIEKNHGKTLEKIAESGGMKWVEVWCAISESGLFTSHRNGITEAVAKRGVMSVYSRWIRHQIGVL